MSSTAQHERLDAAFLRSKHESGLDYESYLATDPAKAASWRKYESQVELSADQLKLIAGFTREIKVLVSSGIWCGDCAVQCPMLAKVAAAARTVGRAFRPSESLTGGTPVPPVSLIDLKFLDRDEHLDLSQQIMINQGLRVPTVIFMAEDFEPVSILGDRTLTRYRAVAARQLGPSCPLPGAPVPQDELNATLQEWLYEFERVHLLLRLSARLRERHGD